MASLVRIATSGGTTYYNPDSPVLVNIGLTPENRPIYAVQKAKHLQPGQQVAYDKDYVNITLEEVADALSIHPAYAEAQKAVFLQNNEGKLVPKLKYHLVEGLWQKAQSRNEASNLSFLKNINHSSLEAKILGNGGVDFSDKEYDALAKEVFSYVVAYHEVEATPSRTLATIKGWVRGEINNPRDSELFKPLGEVNDVFNRYTESQPGKEGPWDSYKLWVTVRQGLMNYFATIKAKGAPPNQNKDSAHASRDDLLTEGGKHVVIGSLAQYVLDRIFRPVSKQHIDVIVTSLSPACDVNVSELEKSVSIREPKAHLYRGLCNEKPADLDAAVFPNKKIEQLIQLVETAVTFGIYEYLHNILKPETLQKSLYLPVNLSNSLISSVAGIKILDEFSADTAFMNVLNLVRSDVARGKVDEQLKLKKGTINSAIETAGRCSAALPKEKWELGIVAANRDMYSSMLAQLSGDSPDSAKAELKARIDACDKKIDTLVTLLAEEYGLTHDNSRLMFDHQLRLSHYHLYKDHVLKTFGDIYRATRSPAHMAFIALAIRKSGTQDQYITFEGAKTTFKEAGLPEDLFKLIPETVFLDKVRVPPAIRRAVRVGKNSISYEF